MKNVLLALLCLFFWLPAQSQNCDYEIPMRIAAQSGLKMRAGAGVNNAVVVYIPKDSIVMMCDVPGPVARFEGITGQWRKVTYREKFGYLFDGFLAPVQSAGATEKKPIDSVKATISATDNGIEEVTLNEQGKVINPSTVGSPQKKEPSIAEENIKAPLKYNLLTEVYNYCGSINSIDPGLVWYAVYQKDGFSYLKRREIQVLKSKFALTNNLEFDVKVENSNVSSTFLIGFNTVQNIDTTRPIVYHNENACDLPATIYPGLQMVLYGATPDANLRNQVVLSATGNVISVGGCPDIQQYKLKITGEKNAQPIEQELNLLLRDLGRCGIPDLRWYGDLNQDGYPDLLFVTERPDQYQFVLLTSDASDADKIYRRAAVWTNFNCD